jgi:hypothetical protein
MKTSAKFILLHLICGIRRPRNWRFNLGGIGRELGRMRELALAAALQGRGHDDLNRGPQWSC